MGREALFELAEGRRWRWKAGELFIGHVQLTHCADGRVEQAKAEAQELQEAAADKLDELIGRLRVMRESSIEPMTHRQRRALRSIENAFQAVEEDLGGTR